LVSTAPGIVGIIAAGVLAGGLAACSTPTASAHLPAAAPSSATAVPVRVQPNAVGWSGMAQRPHHIYVGMGGAPVVRQLAWRNWGGPRATAAGKLDIYWPQPGPISGWRPTTYPVTVRLQGIQTHNGQPSYRTMADFYVNRRGVAKGLSFTFYVLPGGSVPAWNPGRGQGQAPPPDVPVPAAVKSRPLTRLAAHVPRGR
jgi:hypothetical protein